MSDKSKQDYLSWKRNYWQHLLSFISNEVKIDSAKSIADLGCGPAGIFICLTYPRPLSVKTESGAETRKTITLIPVEGRQASIMITAVDPLIDDYEKQLPFFKKSDYPNTTFIKSTIEEFNPSQKFDLVFCMNAINHVNDIEKGFETLKRVCADSGRIVISVDAHNYSFLKYLFRLLPGDVLHPHQYSLKEYKNMLAKDGWKVSVPYLVKEGGLFNHYVLIGKR